MCNNCKNSNCNNCKDLQIPVKTGPQGVPGPVGPQGPQGLQGIPGINGINGVDGVNVIDSHVLSPQVDILEEHDVIVDYLTVPAGIFNDNDKLEVTYVIKFDEVTYTSPTPKISVAASLTNAVPVINGPILIPFLWIGPEDAFDKGIVLYLKYNITRKGNTMTVDGIYQMTPSLVNGVSPNHTFYQKIIFNTNPSFPNVWGGQFYLPLNIGTTTTSAKVTSLYASVEHKKSL